MRDEAQADQYLPDVYLKAVIPERPPSPDRGEAAFVDECCEPPAGSFAVSKRRLKLTWSPVLESLAEIADAAA